MPSKFLTTIVLIWVVVIFSGLYYMMTTQLKEFDPASKLYSAITKPNFDRVFKHLIAKQLNHEDLKNSVIHFTSGHCSCEWIAAPHIESVKQLSAQQQFANHLVNVEKLDKELAAVIPATPAIAVFNSRGDLAYLGPYSSGMFCLPSKGLVEPFIEQQAVGPEAATILTETKGCFCSNS